MKPILWTCARALAAHLALWSLAVNPVLAANDSDAPEDTGPAVVYEQTVQQDRPIAYWRFEESRGKQTQGADASRDAANAQSVSRYQSIRWGHRRCPVRGTSG